MNEYYLIKNICIWVFQPWSVKSSRRKWMQLEAARKERVSNWAAAMGEWKGLAKAMGIRGSQVQLAVAVAAAAAA